MSSHIHVREAEAKPKLHQALLVCERVVFGEAIRRNAPKTIHFLMRVNTRERVSAHRCGAHAARADPCARDAEP